MDRLFTTLTTIAVLTLLAIGILLILATSSPAADCYQSPKAFWAEHPGRHAYWHNVNGAKCWDGRPGKRRAATHVPPPRPRPASTQLPARPQATYQPSASEMRAIQEESRWLSFDGTFSVFPQPWFWTDAQVILSERLMTHGWKRFLCDSIARAARARDRLGLAELPRAAVTTCGP